MAGLRSVRRRGQKGCEIGGEEGGEVGREGEGRRALVFGDECMMSVSIFSISSSQPVLPSITCRNPGSRGVGAALVVSQLQNTG